ncbi:MAG: electron transport complex subunit E [Clostridia bacterium]|nr:electron transport complex subunit E [Clostridia bacterium]
MRYRDIFKNGVIEENPTFVQLLGMCPTLAVTTSVSNSIGMGLSATFVLMCSNFVISLVRKVIPNKIRIAAYIVIIATFVSIIEMLLKAYLPALSESLGMFVPLIVVNCIILARAESFAAKNAPLPSALDGISMGLGFTGALTIIGAVRELLGNGTILGFSIFGASYNPALIFILPPGAFLVLGMIIAVINMITDKKNTKEAGK